MSNLVIHRGNLAWPTVETGHCRQANAQGTSLRISGDLAFGLWGHRANSVETAVLGRLLPSAKAHLSGAENFDESL
jgi:hypothetical protein